MGYLDVIDEAVVAHRRRLQAEADAHPEAAWRRLAARRWGPAVGDPLPGIIIDVPDPDHLDRVLAEDHRGRLLAAGDGPEGGPRAAGSGDRRTSGGLG